MAEKYTMSITLNVLNHLGINLYSNIPSVLSEIVANSWDADATGVKVNIDVDNKCITIIDNGCGMSIDDINNHYLSVGYAKRENNNSESPKYKRKYMGRKGIGKLSMFSIAKTIKVISKKDGAISAFKMDVADITKAIECENKSYHPTELDIDDDNDIPASGTKIILTNLKNNISSITSEYIRKRVARRFSIIGDAYSFNVFVNDKKVTVEDRAYFSRIENIWTYGTNTIDLERYGSSFNKITQRSNEIVVDEEKKYLVNGWIGTVYSSGSLQDGEENLNKIVVVVRGKVGQEDILSDFSEGGLYSKYLIGEIHADFFDDDSQDDMATSSRQEFRRDDPRYLALQKFVFGELKQIQKEWTELRNKKGVDKAKEINPDIGDWYDSLGTDDKESAKKLLGKVNQIVVDDQKRKEILRYGILAFEKMRYSSQLRKLDNLDSENLEALLSVITGFDDVEATMYYQIVKDRVEIIKQLEKLVDENKKEKVIQKYLFNHLWLLDPSWERAQETEFIEKSVLKALDLNESNRLTEDEKAGRLDLGFRQTAGKYVIIELKRAERSVTSPEILEQVMKYHSAITKVLRDSGEPDVFEIIVVLGKSIDGDDSAEHRERVAQSLSAYRSRIVYYSQLINSAHNAYKEFIERSRETQKLVGILDKLAEEQDDE